LDASIDVSYVSERDLHMTFLSEQFDACVKADTAFPSVGGIRKGKIWQLTKRDWCKKASVIKILY